MGVIALVGVTWLRCWDAVCIMRIFSGYARKQTSFVFYSTVVREAVLFASDGHFALQSVSPTLDMHLDRHNRRFGR